MRKLLLRCTGPSQKPCATVSLPAAVTSVAFAPAAANATEGAATHASHLAVGLDDGGVQVWRVDQTGCGAGDGAAAVSASCVWQASRFDAHTAPVRRLCWRQRPGCAQLATCSEDHAVRVFEAVL